METSNNSTTYKSLTEIKTRKESLRTNIQEDSKQIKSLWTDLFHKPTNLVSSTPSKRISGLLNTGAGVLDGVILGWKLYRKFNGGKFFKKK